MKIIPFLFVLGSFFCISYAYSKQHCPEIPQSWEGKSSIGDWKFGYNKTQSNKE